MAKGKPELLEKNPSEVRHCQGCSSPSCVAGPYVVKDIVKS